jgi:DNA repair protein RecO (recombination protein O)
VATYRDRAIVLRTWKLGETDRILSLLTAGRGKVRAVAKGVRRPGSRFGGRLEPYSLVDLQLYEGRSLDGVNQAELVEPHAAVREDWERSAAAAVMAELVDAVAQEGQREPRLFLLLRSALGALDASPPDPTVFLDAFLLRAAASQGFPVRATSCATCGRPGPHPYLSVVGGGSLCVDDAPTGTKAVEPAVVELVDLLVSDRWADLARVDRDTPGREVAASFVRAFVEHHLDRRLRGYDMVPR